MKKRFISIICILSMIIASLINVTVYADEDNEKFTVLVLDTSGNSEFRVNGKLIYTANTAVDYVKLAANKFIEQTLAADNNNYIAIVTYNSTSNIVCGFDNDINTLSSLVNKLSASNNLPNITSGLQTASDLLLSKTGKKNIVIFTTGDSVVGNYDYNGHYNSNTVGSSWHNISTKIHYYAYANVAYSKAQEIKKDTTIYTVGLFQTMSNIPSEGKPIAEFFKLLAKDLASSSSHFYSVEDPNDLNIVFENVANEIQNPTTAYSFEVYPKEGKANINKNDGTGDLFTFTAITSQNTNQISICGDKPDETLWHEITYDYLKDNYNLKYIDNNDGTRTWTCQFRINEIGLRTFMLKINGHETELKTYATLHENKLNTNSDTNNLSMSFDGYEYSDISPSYEYKTAFQKLYQLAIMAGYEDRTVRPQNNITRAEIIKLIISAMGSDYVEEAMILKGDNTKFYDVPGSHWASGYVAVGSQYGFINGTDEKTFAPEENVTYYQAVKMIVSILGYDTMAQNEGGYPYGYFKIGKDIGITEGIPFDDDRVVNRGHVAQMISNALDTPIVKITGYAQDAISGILVPQLEIQNKSGKNYATLLTEEHSTYVVRGRFKSSLTNSANFEISDSENFCGEQITSSNPKTITVKFIGTLNQDFLKSDTEALIVSDSDDNYLLIFAETV